MANSEEQTNPRTASGVSLSGSEPGATTGSADRSPQDDMRDKGRETADEIRQTAQHKAEGVFDQQKGVAADQAKSLSSAFRKMAEELDDQKQGYLSGYPASFTRVLIERSEGTDWWHRLSGSASSARIAVE